ncbi:MAG TPA: hypothetical protein PKH90_13080 [Candidatus Desulfobacillus denitrificans]|nr:hypothetical protein [Candidatus Desulfobacillus denitrificans]
MDEPLEWNTLDEAAAYLSEATEKEWTPRRVVSACLKHYKIGSHRNPRPSLLKAAPPIDTPISVYRFKVGEGMVKKSAGMPPQLFPLYPAQLGDLLTRGKTLVGLARDPDECVENEYVMADERTCVDLAQVGISRRALESLLEIVSGNAGTAVPAKTPARPTKPALSSSDSDDQGMPRKKSEWPAWLVDKAWKDADEIALERYNSGQGKFSARSIAPDIAALWREDEGTWGKGEPRGDGDIRNNGLKGWRFVPPAGKNGRIGKTGKKKMAR